MLVTANKLCWGLSRSRPAAALKQRFILASRWLLPHADTMFACLSRLSKSLQQTLQTRRNQTRKSALLSARHCRDLKERVLQRD